MSLRPHQIIQRPIITEETQIQATKNQYVFKVAPKATKSQIRDAIEQKFNVHVVSVNTMNYMGKSRRRGLQSGRRSAWKKAIVSLREGDTIDLL
jgi:large subunit ribosomal protein L23